MFSVIGTLFNLEKLQFFFGVKNREYPKHIDFRMWNSYLGERSPTTNGDVFTPSNTNKEVVDFHFIDAYGIRVGRSNKFNTDPGDSNRYKATYYFENDQDRNRFLANVISGSGKIKARVQTSDNVFYKYECTAITRNWEEVASSQRPTLRDNFRCLVIR